MFFTDILNTIGLSLNFVGTLLIVFYVRTDKNEWIENEEGQQPGEKWHSLLIKHPRWLYFGVILTTTGFLFSLISSLMK